MTKITEDAVEPKSEKVFGGDGESNREKMDSVNTNENNNFGTIVCSFIVVLILLSVFLLDFSVFLNSKKRFDNKGANLEELYELNQSVYSYLFGINDKVKREYNQRINDVSFNDFIFLYHYNDKPSNLIDDLDDSGFYYKNWVKHFYDKKSMSFVIDMTNKNYFEVNKLVDFIDLLLKENKILESFSFIKKIEDKELNLLLSNVFFRKLSCDNYVDVIDGLIGYNAFKNTEVIFMSADVSKYSNEEVYRQRKSVVGANGVNGLILNDESCILNEVMNSD